MTLNATFNQPNLNVDMHGSGVTADTGLPVVINVLESGSLPVGGNPGDIIIKRTSADFDAIWTAPANRAEQDNTLPITAGAVYTEIGNINALLATI